MSDTSIEWTDKTWNPVSGCTKVSAGCKNCYAERVFPRAYARDMVALTGPRNLDAYDPDYRRREFTDIRTHLDRLEQPLRWRKPQRVFVNSMSDLFHEDVEGEFISKVFSVMAAAEWHRFQVLTKRPLRMFRYIESNKRTLSRMAEVWPLPNVHLGVSVEDQKTADERIPLLLRTPAAVRFVSYEPALGPVNFKKYLGVWEVLQGAMVICSYRMEMDYRSAMNKVENEKRQGLHMSAKRYQESPSIDWLIVGGESGPKARPFNLQWARDVISQCRAAGVPVFVKQLGRNPYEAPEGITPNTSGPDAIKCRLYELDMDKSKGGDMAEWPEDLRVREFPA